MTSTDSWDAVDVHPICLYCPWIFFDLSKRSRKTLIFQLQNLDGCHFVWTRFQLRCRRCASNLRYWPFLTFFRPFQKVTKNFDFSTSYFWWVPLCVDQISETFCHLLYIMTSTDSRNAIDVHPICDIDLDIFSTFPKGHEKLWYFNFRLWMGAPPLCVDQISETFCHLL